MQNSGSVYGSNPSLCKRKRKVKTHRPSVAPSANAFVRAFDAGSRVNLHSLLGVLQRLLGRADRSVHGKRERESFRSESRLPNSLNPATIQTPRSSAGRQAQAGNTHEIVEGSRTSGRGFQLLADAFPLTIWEYELFRARKRWVAPAISRLGERDEQSGNHRGSEQ
jgi:hypothetical protein